MALSGIFLDKLKNEVLLLRAQHTASTDSLNGNVLTACIV